MKRIARATLTVARISLGVALLFYVLTRTGAASTLRGLGGATWLLILIFVQSLVGGGIEAARLWVLFRAAGLRLGLAGAYRVVLIGSFFNLCIPGGTGGDVVKLYYLAAGNRNKGVESAAVMLLDRIIAMAALLMLVLVLAAGNVSLIRVHGILVALTVAAAASLAAILAGAALLGSRSIRESRLFGAALTRLPLRRFIERGIDAGHAFRHRKKALLAAAALSFAGHAMVGIMFALIAREVLPPMSGRFASMLALMGLFANAIPLTPGGLGVGEAAFDQLFSLVGVTGAATLLIVWRLGLLPFAILGAFTYIAGRGLRAAPPFRAKATEASTTNASAASMPVSSPARGFAAGSTPT